METAHATNSPELALAASRHMCDKTINDSCWHARETRTVQGIRRSCNSSVRPVLLYDLKTGCSYI